MESKIFEALEKIRKCYVSEEGSIKYGETYRDCHEIVEKMTDCLDTVKQALIDAYANEKTLETIKNHLSFKDAGIETYNNQTKYLVEIESKDTGATIHIHLNEEEYFDY